MKIANEVLKQDEDLNMRNMNEIDPRDNGQIIRWKFRNDDKVSGQMN